MNYMIIESPTLYKYYVDVVNVDFPDIDRLFYTNNNYILFGSVYLEDNFILDILFNDSICTQDVSGNIIADKFPITLYLYTKGEYTLKIRCIVNSVQRDEGGCKYALVEYVKQGVTCY